MSYRDEPTLRRMYVEERKSAPKIADEYGVSSRTIYNWLEKFDIDRRYVGENRPGVQLRTDAEGYVKWRTTADGKERDVRVHRLLAVLEFGFDAVCGNHVHHKNDIPWDNRSENLEVLSAEEHGRIGGKKLWETGRANAEETWRSRERNEKGQFV